MSRIAKVTSKGQVTVPKYIRDVMNVHEGDEIAFIVRENRVYLERIPAADKPGSAFGILHRPGQTAADMETVRQNYREERGRRYALLANIETEPNTHS